MLETFPPEIFARILEIAIETWGLGFLPPVCLVSSQCYKIVSSTPSLWAILAVGKVISIPKLTAQLAKVKESDLKITFSRGWNRKPVHRDIIPRLASLVHNWVQVDMLTSALTASTIRWVDMVRVKALALRYDRISVDSDFFESSEGFVQPNLRSLSAAGLPGEWMVKVLSPHITYCKITHLRSIPASTMQRYLSLVPNVRTLHLARVSMDTGSLCTSSQVLYLANLTSLTLHAVRDLTPLLRIRAPNLKTLTIRDSTSIFTHCTHAPSLPPFLFLQTLELSHCLRPTDAPFLIAWLARLGALTRLHIVSEGEFGYSTAPDSPKEADLFQALTSPTLCPLLTHLHLDIPLRSLADVLPIARLRTTRGLRAFRVRVCSMGTAGEWDEFRGCFEGKEGEGAGEGCVGLGMGCALGLMGFEVGMYGEG